MAPEILLVAAVLIYLQRGSVSVPSRPQAGFEGP
jgi:hypothetical protein